MARLPQTARPWLAMVALVAVALIVFRLAVGGGALAQSVGWPTPPPGPSFLLPSNEQVQAAVTTSVELPGSEVAVVRPSWPGGVPLIPPIPSTTLTFVEGTGDAPPVTIQVDAGTFSEVVQLRVSPADVGRSARHHGLLWAIEIEGFSATGQPLRQDPQRPLRVTVPTGPMIAPGIDGRQLLFARMEGGELLPIVTSVDMAGQFLTARLLRLGTIAVVQDET